MRSESEIQDEIRRLNAQLPELMRVRVEDVDINMPDAVRAQIDVLSYDMDEDTISSNMGLEGEAEAGLERNWTEYAGDSAMAARHWLDGVEETSPSEDWERWL